MLLEGQKMYDKIDTLKEVKVDSTNWLVYYEDPKSSEKWVVEYPNSEYHGGGVKPY